MGYPWGNLVEIFSKDKKLSKAMQDEKERLRSYGKDMAKKLQLRLAEIRAAESLADFWPPKSPPARCHELVGGLAGTFSIDLKQPYRLLFRPVEDIPASDTGNQAPTDDSPQSETGEKARWASIKAIELVSVEDTHG